MFRWVRTAVHDYYLERNFVRFINGLELTTNTQINGIKFRFTAVLAVRYFCHRNFFFGSVKAGLPRLFYPKRSIQKLLDSESLFVLAIGLGKLILCDVGKDFDSTEPISTSFRNDWNSLGHLAAKYPHRVIAATHRRLFLKD